MNDMKINSSVKSIGKADVRNHIIRRSTMTEKGWIDDIFHDFLQGSTYHLEENLPHLSEVIAEESERLSKEEKRELIAEFLSRLHILHRKIIDENLKRNMKAEDHVEYNDHFNSEFDEWEKRK